MKAPKNYKVTSATVTNMEKEAARVTRMQNQIKQMQEKLYSIEMENRWVNYLGDITLTEDESIRFSVACRITNSAYRTIK